jgi:hypothetical protein
MKQLFYLQATDYEQAHALGVCVEEPAWPRIERCVDRAFEFGGQVFLYAAIRRNDDKLALGTLLGMESHPEEYRLIYHPGSSTQIGGKTQRREWWEPGDAPFRGITLFDDHPWDNRTVCRDKTVALQMFRDFFEHGDLTEVSLRQTRSVWDRKPR